MARYSPSIQNLISSLAKLPGIGNKSAQNIAFHILSMDDSEAAALTDAIAAARTSTKRCTCCQNFTDRDPCPICSDASRDPTQICLVAEWDSMLTMEEGNFFHGNYLILGGLLAPLDHSPAESLEMQRLYERLAEGTVQELILALGSTADAEATATFVKQQGNRRFPAVRVTRLAQGIPLGAEVRFMDRETLRQSLLYRQDL